MKASSYLFSAITSKKVSIGLLLLYCLLGLSAISEGGNKGKCVKKFSFITIQSTPINNQAQLFRPPLFLQARSTAFQGRALCDLNASLVNKATLTKHESLNSISFRLNNQSLLSSINECFCCVLRL